MGLGRLSEAIKRSLCPKGPLRGSNPRAPSKSSVPAHSTKGHPKAAYGAKSLQNLSEKKKLAGLPRTSLSWHLSRDRRQDLCDRERHRLKMCFAILCFFASGHTIMPQKLKPYCDNKLTLYDPIFHLCLYCLVGSRVATGSCDPVCRRLPRQHVPTTGLP